MLGGDFQNDAQVMVGPILRTCAAQFYVDKLFVGTDGFSAKLGFTNNDHLRVQAVRDMAEHAEQVVVVTESVKFAQQSVVPMNLGTSVKMVVTDARMPALQEQVLTEMGIEVCKVGQDKREVSDE